MANSVAKYLFIPFPVLIAASLAPRNRPGLPWLALPAILFGFLYGRLFLPGLPARSVLGAPVLRAMTFNVLNVATDYDAAARAILSGEVDLVGLQELIPANAAALEERIGSRFPYHTPLPTEHRLQVALFSRYPILEWSELNLPWLDLSVHAVVAIDDASLHVFVIHLIPTLLSEVPAAEWPTRVVEREAIRTEQIGRLLGALPNSGEPALVLCDCNFTETTAAYAEVNTRLRDGFADTGWGFGHTVRPAGWSFALQRIDYIWYSTPLQVSTAEVVHAGGSDHYPVVAAFALVE
jgi:endonuclease/exonuclease/phosphatase (EEP) superfamily protein YafD